MNQGLYTQNLVACIRITATIIMPHLGEHIARESQQRYACNFQHTQA